MLTVCFFLWPGINAQQPKQKADSLDIVNTEKIGLAGFDFDTTAVPNDELTRSIQKLFDVTGFLKGSAGLIKALYETEDMKAMLPEEFRSKFIAAYEENGFAYKWLMLSTIKSYRKHFTLDEIKQLISFYQTPLGKKMSTVYPDLMRENSLDGAKLGKWVGTIITN